MTNPSQPRSPSRVGNQELTQLLIRSIDKLRTLPDAVSGGNDQMVVELQGIIDAIDNNTAELVKLVASTDNNTAELANLVASAASSTAELAKLVASTDNNTAAITECLTKIMQTYTAEGGAGLTTTADRIGVNLTVTNALHDLSGYDAKMLPEADATADTGFGTIAINATGIWALSFTMTMNITGSNSNSARYMELVLRNTIDDDFIVIGTVNIPRYSEIASLSGTLRFTVDSGNLSEPLIVAVRTPLGEADVVIEDILDGAQFSVGRELTSPPV